MKAPGRGGGGSARESPLFVPIRNSGSFRAASSAGYFSEWESKRKRKEEEDKRSDARARSRAHLRRRRHRWRDGRENSPTRQRESAMTIYSSAERIQVAHQDIFRGKGGTSRFAVLPSRGNRFPFYSYLPLASLSSYFASRL